MFVYKIFHPSSNKIYIGKTNDLKARFAKHLSNKRTTKLTSWIKSLKNENFKPIMELIEEVPDIDWQPYEVYWISYYRSIYGFDRVLNHSAGGYFSPYLKGRKQKPESIAKMLDTQRKNRLLNPKPKKSPQPKRPSKPKIKKETKKIDPETKEKNRLIKSLRFKGSNNPFFGKTHTPEAVEKIKKANIGLKKDPEETRKRIQKLIKITDFNEISDILYQYHILKISKRKIGVKYGVANQTIASVIERHVFDMNRELEFSGSIISQIPFE